MKCLSPFSENSTETRHALSKFARIAPLHLFHIEPKLTPDSLSTNNCYISLVLLTQISNFWRNSFLIRLLQNSTSILHASIFYCKILDLSNIICLHHTHSQSPNNLLTKYGPVASTNLTSASAEIFLLTLRLLHQVSTTYNGHYDRLPLIEKNTPKSY